MADPRRAIHAYLTPEAHDRWHDFAAEQGVSVSGLLEAIALDWKDSSIAAMTWPTASNSSPRAPEGSTRPADADNGSDPKTDKAPTVAGASSGRALSDRGVDHNPMGLSELDPCCQMSQMSQMADDRDLIPPQGRSMVPIFPAGAGRCPRASRCS